MPAYFESGFSVREPMWHGLGTVLEDYPTDWDDARRKAGLDWEPQLVPLYHEAPGPVIGQPSFNPVDSHRLVTRSDNGAPLGVVSDTFELISHETMGEILDALLGVGLKFETAGVLKGGAHVYALVYLDEPHTICGDDTASYPYVALLNCHNGDGACKALPTTIRVVCWNTYSAASMLGDRSGHQFIFRHTAGVKDRIEEAKQTMAGIRDDFKAWETLAVELYGCPVDEVSLNHFVEDFISMPPPGSCSDRVVENVNKARLTFKSIYLDSVSTEGHRGTGLGLVDAAVEYLDHVRGYRSTDSYMGRTLMRPEPLKQRAVSLVRGLAK